MKEYDPKKPLISIHVPKSAGTSFNIILHEWFKNNLYRNYYNEKKGKLPKKIRLKHFFTGTFREKLCISGHFNKDRGFGIQKYYPEVNQFITILRDPFELIISEYFYSRRVGYDWKDKSRIPKDNLKKYILQKSPNMLNHFPFELKLEDYQFLLNKYFIHIGITEDLTTSVNIIAKKLGFKSPTKIETLNKSERTQKIPEELKAIFIEKHPLEYAIYEYAKMNYDKY